MPPNNNYQQFQTHSSITSHKRNRSGILVIVVGVLVLTLIICGAFAAWAFSSMLDYKNNSDKKSEAAVTIAVANESTKKDNEFLVKEKSPTKSYKGPEAYGSLEVNYPKTWSAYVVQADRTSQPVDAYFHPNYVPGVSSSVTYALRLQVSNQAYDVELKQFESKVKSGKVTVSPYVSPNVKGITGVRIEGEINTGQKGIMILMPLRDKTIRISTESQQFINDFNTIVLPNFKFIP